jgi:hypothetical protein
VVGEIEEIAMRIKSGGGYNAKVTSSVKASAKVEPRSRAIDPASVSTLGISTQFKKPNLEMGPGYTTKPQPSTGIANARKGPAGAGPGGMGRTIYKSGSQSPTPAAKEMPAGRNTLAEYGPDSVTARGKR